MATVLAVGDTGAPAGRAARLIAAGRILTGAGGTVAPAAEGVIAVFARALDAIGAALEPALREGRPRVALATGEVTGLTSGPAISRAAHLRAVGHPGQILLDKTTYEAVADRLPRSASVRSLGTQRLADLGRPELVHEVRDDASGVDFPPLRSLGLIPNNLPLQLTTFVGRQVEIDEVLAAIGAHRFVTLTGAGGCGKTRLAVHVAALASTAFEGGVWIADLASVADEGLVPAAVGAAAGVDEAGQGSIPDAVIRAFAGRTVLLVLDNCEHVTTAAREIAEDLLSACPDLTVLATSREPLAASGEHVWTVPSLPVPAEGETRPDRSASVELFYDRARAARSNFRLTSENVASVAQICRRLDGIPLAIELAAARSRTLTPRQIAEQLSDRFSLLTSGRGRLQRQQTLQASVEWSYELLAEPDRLMLQQLSVFAGSFSLDAVEGVCGDVPDTLDVLSRLVDRSLVQADHDADPPRYRLLDTIRHYARDKLIASGTMREIRERHLVWYATRAVTAYPESLGEDMPAVLDELDQDIDNFRAAHDWSLDGGSSDMGLTMVAALWNLWYTRHCREGAQRIGASFERGSSDNRLLADAALVAADLAYYGGDAAGTARWADRALSIAADSDDSLVRARGIGARAWPNIALGLPGAREGMREAFAASQELGDLAFLVTMKTGLITEATLSGQPEEVADYIDTFVNDAQAHGNPRQIATALIHAAQYSLTYRRFDEADARLDRAIEILERLRDGTFTPLARTVRAAVWSCQGRSDEAAVLADRARAEAERHHSAWVLAANHSVRAQIDHDRALPDARARIDTAAAVVVDAGIPAWSAWMMGLRSFAASDAGDMDRAIELGIEGVEVAARPYGGSGLAPCEVALAHAYGSVGERERALALALEAATRPLAGQFRPGVIDALETVGSLLKDDAPDDATRVIGAVDAERARVGMPLSRRWFTGRGVLTRDLRLAIGLDAFTRLLEEGSAMTLSEIVAYVRRGRGRRTRPLHGWESVTPTELEVVRLASQGLRNVDIAAKLFMSPGTVKTHLAHVYAKLGVKSRAQLAALATQRGI